MQQLGSRLRREVVRVPRPRRFAAAAVPEVRRRDGTSAPINKTRGFIEYERNPEPYRPPAERLLDYEELNTKHEPLELKLENKISKETPPYLGGEADEVIYGRQMGGSRSELNEIRDLNPRKFRGAAGLTSNEVIKANPDLEHYIFEQPPGSSCKIELRRGGCSMM